MSADDPICGICHEPRSAHVPTSLGPYTHPREARGEGVYVVDRPGYTMGGAMGGFPGDDDIEMPPTYKFVPTKKHLPSDSLWRPADEATDDSPPVLGG